MFFLATAEADGCPTCSFKGGGPGFVRVAGDAELVFPRYVPKLQRVEPSKFVPREGVVTPVPAWKLMDWAKDVLPEHAPARKPPSR
jgi:hypothetical protein